MISLTLSSMSSRSSGPWPRMSSAISEAIRSRSSFEIPVSAASRVSVSVATRSRSANGSMFALKS